jgi:hypothetical protein
LAWLRRYSYFGIPLPTKWGFAQALCGRREM